MAHGWTRHLVVADFAALLVSRASLAQSAERFHGKEKVESSILSGGSQAMVRSTGHGRAPTVGRSTAT